MSKITSSTNHKPNIVYGDEYVSPTYFDSAAFKAYQKMVEALVLKSKVRRLSIGQIKRELGNKLEDRFNLLDVLETSEVLESNGLFLRTWSAR